MTSQQLAKSKLPDAPGVYFFLGAPKRSPGSTRNGREILYIGKATSLRDRTRSYFAKDLIATRGASIVDMVFKATKVEYQQTDTVLEALILEANLIKKYQPYYNVKEKDDKSWNYAVITKEEIPKVLTIRGRELEKHKLGIEIPVLGNAKIDAMYGPFTSGGQFKEAMKIVRRIFPFMDGQSSKKDNYQFYKQLGLAPSVDTSPQLSPVLGEGANAHVLKNYLDNIRNIKLFFQGKKTQILKSLESDMKRLAKQERFEEASRVRNQIFALSHINDVALIKNDSLGNFTSSEKTFRIEAYDIAHMSGKNMVGVMTVVENGDVNKNEYRKFIIRSQTGANDIGALEEVLSRRFRHTEWGMPDLVVMDGGEAQLRIGKQVLKRYQLDIPVVSVVKDDRHKAKGFLGDEAIVAKNKKAMLLANSEAHRYGIAFHTQKRAKSFLK